MTHSVFALHVRFAQSFNKMMRLITKRYIISFYCMKYLFLILKKTSVRQKTTMPKRFFDAHCLFFY
jgi:hypothetical protein